MSENNNNSFFKTLLKPKNEIERKLGIYEKENTVDQYCKKISIWIFVLVSFVSFLPIILLGNGAGMPEVFIPIVMGAVSVGSIWLLCYIQAFIAGLLGNKHSAKRLFLAPFTIWKQWLVINIAITLIYLFLLFLFLPLGILFIVISSLFLFIAYMLGITAASFKMSYLKAFGVHILSGIALSITSGLLAVIFG